MKASLIRVLILICFAAIAVNCSYKTAQASTVYGSPEYYRELRRAEESMRYKPSPDLEFFNFGQIVFGLPILAMAILVPFGFKERDTFDFLGPFQFIYWVSLAIAAGVIVNAFQPGMTFADTQFYLMWTIPYYLVYGRPAIRGWHYLFVRHPAEPVVRPALKSGGAIDIKAIAKALWPSSSDIEEPPPAYKSQHMKERAEALKAKLEAYAGLAKAMERRERARAALADAERQVKKLKDRSEDND